MKWSPLRHATGFPGIDTQHKMLFQMSEDFREALERGQGARVYGVLLESLANYASAHFGSEERCMHRHQCPVAETNSTAHAEFLAVLRDVTKGYGAAGFQPGDARRLVEYIDHWLDSHIGSIDTQLKGCLN